MDLISFGPVFLEVVFGRFDQLPLPGEEIFIDPFAFSLGGAITIAVTACQGGVSAGLATLLGDDLGSRLAEEASAPGLGSTFLPRNGSAAPSPGSPWCSTSMPTELLSATCHPPPLGCSPRNYAG